MGLLPFLLAISLFAEGRPTTTMILCAALALFSILTGFIVLRQSSDQIRALAEKTQNPAEEALPGIIEQDFDGELSDIANGFNALVKRLDRANQDIQNQSIRLLEYANDLAESYARIEKEEKLRRHLRRYLGSDFVDQLLASGDQQLMENKRRELSVMFADIRSFTSLSEHMEPEDVVAMLNEYFSEMVDIIFQYNGMLDKFAGDQIMAVFGHTQDAEEGARNAVQAAFVMQEATGKLMRQRASQGLPVFEVGIGINTGSAIIGNLGSENRMDYTVIGDAVNAAARLEEQAKGGQVVLGEQTYGYVCDLVQVGSSEMLQVRNRTEPLRCYTVAALQKKRPHTSSQRHETKHAAGAFGQAAHYGAASC